jgi:hypothetical protein
MTFVPLCGYRSAVESINNKPLIGDHVCDGAEFKNKLMGVMDGLFLTWGENKQISHTDDIQHPNLFLLVFK